MERQLMQFDSEGNVIQPSEDMFEDPAYRQQVLWVAYKQQCEVLSQAQNLAANYRGRLESTCAFAPPARVRYEGEIYYVLNCKLSVGMGNELEPTYWLTLTKLTKAGFFPSRPLRSAYCNSDKVEVLGKFGDNQNVVYFEAQEQA